MRGCAETQAPPLTMGHGFPLSFRLPPCMASHRPSEARVGFLTCQGKGLFLGLLPAPVVLMPPRDIHNVTGTQVFLSCEVKAVPTPVITWKKVISQRTYTFVCVHGHMCCEPRRERQTQKRPAGGKLFSLVCPNGNLL